MVIIQSIRTKSDSSGNPRKLLLVYKRQARETHPALVKVVKYSYGFPKGYDGKGIIGLASHEVTPSDYHATIRYAKLAGILETDE